MTVTFDVEENEDGELDKEDVAEFAGDDEDAVDVSYFAEEAISNKMTKKAINPMMFKNPWKCGKESFAKKNNVVDVRAKEEEIRKKKVAARKAILAGIGDEERDGDDIMFSMEVDGLPQWQVFTRSVENNLGLD